MLTPEERERLAKMAEEQAGVEARKAAEPDHECVVVRGERLDRIYTKRAADWRTIASYLRSPGAQQQPQWLPIESAPKDGTQVVVRRGDMRIAARWSVLIQDWSLGGSEGPTLPWGPPTHWTPLPAPPVSTEEAEKES